MAKKRSQKKRLSPKRSHRPSIISAVLELLESSVRVETMLITLLRRQRRNHEEEIDMANAEKEVVDQLVAELEATNSEISSIELTIERLVSAVENSGDVSPELQKMLDTVKAQKGRIAAANLKGTPSDPSPPTPQPA